MNNIREIVTRAVLAKGRKIIKLKEKVDASSSITSVLGCWIINHNFTATLDGKEVIVKGSFENNIWYSYDDNKATDVAKTTTDYETRIKVREIVCDNISDKCDVVARVLQQPTCTNATINCEFIEVDVVLEILVEVIGEAKMVVNVVTCNIQDDPVDDFENEINEDFLSEG